MRSKLRARGLGMILAAAVLGAGIWMATIVGSRRADKSQYEIVGISAEAAQAEIVTDRPASRVTRGLTDQPQPPPPAVPPMPAPPAGAAAAPLAPPAVAPAAPPPPLPALGPPKAAHTSPSAPRQPAPKPDHKAEERRKAEGNNQIEREEREEEGANSVKGEDGADGTSQVEREDGSAEPSDDEFEAQIQREIEEQFRQNGR